MDPTFVCVRTKARENEEIYLTINLLLPNTGVVTTFAGGGSPGGNQCGYLDAQGVAAMFNFPRGIIIDPFGQLFVADSNNNLIRTVSPTG